MIFKLNVYNKYCNNNETNSITFLLNNIID